MTYRERVIRSLEKDITSVELEIDDIKIQIANTRSCLRVVTFKELADSTALYREKNIATKCLTQLREQLGKLKPVSLPTTAKDRPELTLCNF